MSETLDARRGTARAVTIVDIARLAGVSKSTVSLVLKGSPLVRDDTRRKVQEAIGRLGYVYNRSAASLRTARTDFVGMVISDLMNPFFAELAVGIEDALYNLGYVPILANTNEDRGRQAKVLQSLREHGVAGIIMSPARGTDGWELSQTLPPGTPAVITMRRVEGSPLPYVGPDNPYGTQIATEHLVSLGHRRIAFIGGDHAMTTQRERVHGFFTAMRAAGLPTGESLVFDSMPTRAGGDEAMTRALAVRPAFTAIVCYNDLTAFGAMRAIARGGLKVGRDIAVIGFDNLAEAAQHAPPLTTIDANTREMGARAAQSLLGLIDGFGPSAVSFTGTARLILRDSSGARIAPGVMA